MVNWKRSENVANTHMLRNRSKPGACRHFLFATNPVLSNFIRKIIYFVQFHIFAPNYSEGSYFFENETNLDLNNYKKQIKLKKPFQNSF